MSIIIGTRGSRLALAQAEQVQRLFNELAPEVTTELRIIKTQGDLRLDLRLDASGDKGLFTSELDQALRRSEIDIAVHSLKDVPTTLGEGTQLGALLPREDPADALIGSTLEALPHGARVGTSSPRRVAQLLELRPDLDIQPIRGNVETRLSKVRSGEYHALVMAVSGLKRLGLEGEIAQRFTPRQMVSAPGQGAIAVQMRQGEEALSDILGRIHCPQTALSVELERTLLSGVGGGCAIPLGCLCMPCPEPKRYQLYLYYQYAGQGIRLERTFDECEADTIAQSILTELQARISTLR